MSTILVIEDEKDIRDLVEIHLSKDGHRTVAAANSEEGLSTLNNNSNIDLLLLDWMLPGLSGVEVARLLKARDETKNIPILMITAKSAPDDIVSGLEAGADDYITKPFDFRVLRARVKALLRRGGTTSSEKQNSKDIVLGNLVIKEEFHQVFCSGNEITLTPSEFKLLVALAQHRGRVLHRDKLVELVQGAGVAVIDRTIDTHIFGLRKKLDTCSEFVETVRGVGYRIKQES